MSYRTVAMLALASTMIAGTAVAQTTTAPGTTTTPPAKMDAPMPASGTAGMTGKFMTEQEPGEFRASKFVGLDVYGPDNQKIGDISEVLMDKNGQAKAAVIGVGGFLGIGQKNVGVPFDAIQWVNEKPVSSSAANTAPPATAANTASSTTAPTVPATTRSPAEQAAYNGYPDHAKVSLTKADLQNAPEFKYYADTHSATGAGSNANPPARKM